MKTLSRLLFCLALTINASAQTTMDSVAKNIIDLANDIRELRHPSPLPATLQLYNNTDKEIYAAYVAYDYDAQCWVSNGWYKIEAYGSKDINLGKYAGSVYIHGMQHTYMGFGSDNIWGKDYSFC